MSDSHWRNGLAFGLIVGGGAVVLILVWWYGPTCQPNAPCSYPHESEPHNGSIWYDTAAQWLAAVTSLFVAIFTFITILLVRQALAADDAALDEAKMQTKIARAVGEAQVRAYLTIEKVQVTPTDRDGRTFWDIAITLFNSGHSPARKVEAHAQPGATMIQHIGAISRDLRSGEERTIHLISSTGPGDVTQTESLNIIFMTSIFITFQDVFMRGEEREVIEATLMGSFFSTPGKTFDLAVIDPK